jgi:hypothetical protein
MSWPGTTTPTAPRRGRRRKTSRRGTSSVERAVATALRRDGLLAKAPKPDTRGVCAEHAFDALGFTSAWELVRFVDALDVPQAGKRRRCVRLPKWKADLAGVRSVRAIRCRSCNGSGPCRTCDSYGWGFVVTLKRAREGAAETPA